MKGEPAAGSTLIKAWVPRSLHSDLSVAATAEGLRLSEFLVRAVRREIARTNRKHSRRNAA